VGDHFGLSVAVYNETIVIGAPDAEGVAANPSDGTVNVFNRTNGTWVRDSSYNNAIPTTAPSAEPQRAGAAVEVYRESFVAGVPGRRLSAVLYPGAAYSFAERDIGLAGNWLMATPSTNNALVGASVARDGSTVVVGAPGDDFLGQADSGAVYIFRVYAPPWQPTASVTPSLTPTLTLTPSSTLVTPTSPPDSTPAPQFFAVRRPTLTWNWVTWAQGYQIQIDDDPDFGSPIPVPDELTAATFSYTLTSDLADGIYYWQVRARKNAVEWGAWSAPQTIIVSAP
jgi:hypothetical protein